MIAQLKNKILYSTFGKDTIWTLGSQISVMIVLLVTNKLITSFWTIDEFGLYNVIKRCSAVLSYVLLGGLGITLPRYLSFTDDKNKTKHSLNILVSSLIYFSIIILLVSLILFYTFPRNLQFIGLEPLFKSLFVLFTYSVSIAIFTFYNSFLRGIGNFKLFSITQTTYQILLLIITCIFFLVKGDCYDLFLLWSIVGIVYVLYNIINKHNIKIFLKSIKNNLKLSKVKEITKYSLPRLLSDLLLFGLPAFPTIYLSIKDSLEITSYYSVGITFVTMTTPIFSFLGVILLPYISKALFNNNLHEVGKKLYKLIYLYLIISVGITFLLYFFMPFWIKTFFSFKYLSIVDISRITILAIVPNSMYLLFRNPIDAISIFPWNLLILLLSSIIIVILFIFSNSLIQYSYSFLGMSIIEGLLSVIIWQILYKKKIKFYV